MPYDLRIGERAVVLPPTSGAPRCVGHVVVVDEPLGLYFGWNPDGSLATPPMLSYGVACWCGNESYFEPHELRRIDPPRDRERTPERVEELA